MLAELNRTGWLQDFEARMMNARGEPIWVLASAKLDADGFYEGSIIDITARKQAERALRDSEARYRSVVDAMTAGIVVHDQDGVIVASNAAAERILGLTVDQMMGRTSLDPRWRAIREDGSPFPGEEHPGWVTLRTGEPRTGVTMGVHKPSGELTWISINSRRVTPLGEEGAYSVVASFTDITEKKLADERVLASLREKEVLLKEVHHRVKNNLQIVTSLLYLQAMRADDARLGELLRESRDRIASIALVHQQLYEAPELSRIPFDTYVRDLAASLYRSYGVSPERIALRVAADGLVLSVGTAVPCGLVLNELLSNALKYAFPDGRSGTISIELALEGDTFRLRVSDDGVGLPDDLERRARTSLGMKLIERLAAQLGATLRREGGPRGATFELVFARDGAS
jgi:PAS domain S-box-containing protein